MLSLPLGRHILDYEPPGGFVIPTFTMCDSSFDPYDHMLHYNQEMTLNADNDLITPQKYPGIFIIILLYIPGINRTKLGFFREFVKCYMIV